jgi:vacuolar-type H+-ATPase subunit I/STV1
VIIPMARVRLIGRKDELPLALAALQDAGTLHLATPAEDVPRHAPTARERRRPRRARLGCARSTQYAAAALARDGGRRGGAAAGAREERRAR